MFIFICICIFHLVLSTVNTTNYTSAATTTAYVTSTESAPNATTTHSTPPNPTTRKFDGLSFVGGMLLAAGLMALFFIGYKIYRSRTATHYQQF